MKKLIFLIFFLVSVSTIAQEVYNDSTYYFDGAGWLWAYSGKEYVTERNEQKQVIEKISYDKTMSTDYRLEYKTVYSYYSDNITPETMEIYAWNSDSLMWKKTALYNYREDGKTSMYYVLNFDFETNLITDGYRYSKIYNGGLVVLEFYDLLDVENNG